MYLGKTFQIVVTFCTLSLSFLGAVCDFIQKALCYEVPSWQALSPGGNAVYGFDPIAPVFLTSNSIRCKGAPSCRLGSNILKSKNVI